MLRQEWHKRVICYRLEDRYGNSPYYYDGHKAIIPNGYFCAYMNPARYRESDYRHFCNKMDLYEYLLLPSALTYGTGEVLFRVDDVISKTKLGR